MLHPQETITRWWLLIIIIIIIFPNNQGIILRTSYNNITFDEQAIESKIGAWLFPPSVEDELLEEMFYNVWLSRINTVPSFEQVYTLLVILLKNISRIDPLWSLTIHTIGVIIVLFGLLFLLITIWLLQQNDILRWYLRTEWSRIVLWMAIPVLPVTRIALTLMIFIFEGRATL